MFVTPHVRTCGTSCLKCDTYLGGVRGAVFSIGDPGYHGASEAFDTKGEPMISVVEWVAPSRNAAWVAACFGSLGA